MNQNGKSHSWVLPAVIVFLVIAGAMAAWNQVLLKELTGAGRETPQVTAPPVEIPPAQPDARPTGEVFRMARMDPSRTFEQSILYVGDKEIARFKSRNDEIYDVEGQIPDGRVEFVNETKQTYGEEHYYNGVRDGAYREYYSKGNIHKEIEYFHGRMMAYSEYFFDGQLRMEADYSDALLFGEDREVGVGRIYHRNGAIMYEWSLTNSAERGVKKAYNFKGELEQVWYYDHNGKLTESINYRK